MIKDFLKHSLIYSLGIFFTRGVSFLLLPLYTHVLTTKDYGLISLLSSASILLLPFLSLELSQAIAIYYSESKSPKEKESYLSTAFSFILLSNLVYLLLFYLVFQQLDFSIFHEVNDKKVLLIVFLAIISSNFYDFLQKILLWQQKPVRYSMISLACVTVTILCSIYFVVMQKFGIYGVFLAYLVGNSLGALLSLIAIGRAINLSFDVEKFKRLFKFSLPLIPSNLAFFLFLYVNQFVVNHYLGLTQAGIYAVGSRFAIVVNLMLAGVANALSPFIYKGHEEPQTKRSLEFITRVFVVLSICLVISLAILGNDLVSFFTTQAYLPAASLIPLLAAATFLIHTNLFVPGLIIHKRTGTILFLNLIAAILNIIFSIFLVPSYGIQGAGFAAVLSSGIFCFAYIQSSQSVYRVSYQTKNFLMALIGGVPIILVSTFFASRINLFEKFLLLLFITVGLMLLGLTTSERKTFLSLSKKKIYL